MTDRAASQTSRREASGGGATTSAAAASETKPHADDGIDQRQEPRATDSRLGLWVAVIAALIAAAAAITSAVVSAYTSLTTTHSQSHAAAILAERQERRDAYAKLVTDVEELDTRESQIAYWFRRYQEKSDPYPSQMLAQMNAEYTNAWLEYERQDDIVTLIDSPAVDEVASKVSDAENAVHAMVNTFLVASDQGGTLNAVLDRLPEFGKYNDNAVNALLDFKDACKKDLQDLGYGDH